MASFLISPPEETEWSMDPSDFAARLEASWPDADVRWVDDPVRTHALDFVIEIDGEPVDGGIHRDGQAIGLEGDPDACAKAATWFRGQVPPEQPLIFYDQGYQDHVELRADTTADEIAGPFR